MIVMSFVLSQCLSASSQVVGFIKWLDTFW